MTIKERFIPYRRSDIIEMCEQDNKLSNDEIHVYKEFCKILSSLFHFELHKSLEVLKDCYAPFDPDRDTRLLDRSDEILSEQNKKLEKELIAVLEQANYERVSEQDLQEALEAESLFKVKLHVDFNDFEEVVFFRRGLNRKTEQVRVFFGLKKKQIELQVYERILVYVRFKDQQYFDDSEKQSDIFFEPGSTIIKLFRNVPKNDMEMLFPNTEVQMKPIDKLLIGVPTAVGGIFMLITKLGGTLLLVFSVLAFWLGFRQQPATIDQAALIALALGVGTLGGFLWRQFSKYKNRKIQFMKQLAENLYFKNLDNNAGVFHHLIDSAEEEECKETILAYYHLLTSEKQLTSQQLDDLVEMWFESKFNCDIDFETDDALRKLTNLQLVEQFGDKFQAKPLVDSRKQLDILWDSYY